MRVTIADLNDEEAICTTAEDDIVTLPRVCLPEGVAEGDGLEVEVTKCDDQ